MARTSTDAAEFFQNAYDKSKDFIGSVKKESRAAYEDVRRWAPQHPTAIAVSASAALCLGAFGYALGRRRSARTERLSAAASAAVARTQELDLSPFFRFLKLWMLYRVATRD